MNSILEQVNSAGRAFVEFALPMLVQACVLILILLLADLLLRKKVRAVFRYWIWMLVLLKLILPTWLSSPWSLGRWFGEELAYVGITHTPAGPQVDVAQPVPANVTPLVPANTAPIIEPAPVEAGDYALPTLASPPIPPIAPDTAPTAAEPVGPPPVPLTQLSWQAVVFLAWLAVVIAMGLLLLQRAIFVRGLIGRSRPADGLMVDTLEFCCERMGVKRKIGLRVSATATCPAVCGLLRPVILVPASLAPSLSSNQLQAVLLHELAHIKRGDLWANLAQTVLQIVYFYNPLLWLTNAVIRRVREQAVDEMVLVAMGEQAPQYPDALVNVAKLAFKRPALSLRLIGVVESKSALAGRIKHILNRPIPKTAKLGMLGLLVIIAAAAILLPMAKNDAPGAWFGRGALIRFSSDDKLTGTGTYETIGGTTTWLYSKNYTVEFRKDEGLAIVAELYQVGKPMRSLGCKIFSGSEQPQKLSVVLRRNFANEDKTTVEHDLKITLGDQSFHVNDIRVKTPEFFNNAGWGFFNGSEIDVQERRGRPYAEFENLLRVRACPNAGRPRAPRIWMPTYNNVTWIDSDAYFVSVNMLALSQLDNLQVDVPHYAEKMQLPDGTYISGDSTKEQRKAVADDYLLGIRRALMREQMPLPELTAHKYYKIGEPIQISVGGKGSQWKPALDEIYHDGDVNPMFFLIDGKEYASRLGFGPFAGGGRTLHLPGELYVDAADFRLPPGRHTVAYGWKNVDVVNPDEPDRVVRYDKLVTDVAEFEVVEEIPADYYAEIYEEGREEILRASVQMEFTDEMQKFRMWGSLLALQIQSVPFDIAFEVYAQAEGSEERFYAGRVARQANSLPYIMGCDREVDELNWDTVGEKRWRLILVPSKNVAMRHPPIRHYYGREFVTEWATFEKTDHFEENRQRHIDREQRRKTPHYGGPIKADKPVDLDRLGRRGRGNSDQAWPLPAGFELGWSPENGGILRIDPNSNVRMLWFPEANASLTEPTAETRRRLVELPDSRLTEINPPKGQRTLIAVRSSEGKIYFVRVHKVNETWANLSWWPAEESPGEVGNEQVEVLTDKPLVALDPDSGGQIRLDRNWPCFRGPVGAGIGGYADVPVSWDGPSGKRILWKSSVPLGGHSSPIVWEDRIFISGGKDDELEVYCFDSSSGKLLWAGSVPMTRPTGDKGFEVMEDVGLAAPTMVTDGKRVCAIFVSGDLGCFDFHGQRLWTKSLGIPDNVYGHASSLAMCRNLVIVQLDQAGAEDGKSKLIALDVASGVPVWETKRPVANSWSSPIVAKIGGKDTIVTCADPWVIAYDPATGVELWRAKCLSGDVAPSPCCADGKVYAIEPYGKLVAIDAQGRGNVTDSHVKWAAEDFGPDVCSPLSNGRWTMLLASEGTVACYNTEDGLKLWEEELDVDFMASPSLVGDRVYLLSRKGTMFILQAGSEYKLLGKSELGEDCYASPAFADGRIYIRGEKNLYCIGNPEHNASHESQLAATRPNGVTVELVALFTGQIKDDPPVMLDLDSGRQMQLDTTWPDEYDIGWDNDAGGSLFTKPGGPVKMLPIAAAGNFSHALAIGAKNIDSLPQSTVRGVPAEQSRYILIKTSQGNIAVVQVDEFDARKATIIWRIIRRPVEQADAEIKAASTNDPGTGGPAKPLDVRFVGVRPDNSDDILDAKGKKTGPANLSVRGGNTWAADCLRRDFVFELPATKGPILFLNRRVVKAAGEDIELCRGLANPLYPDRVSGRTYAVLDTHIPRKYRGSFLGLVDRQRDTKRVDVTLQYFCGPPGKALFRFTGPFELGQTVSADNKPNYSLKITEDDGSGVYEGPGLMFHFTAPDGIPSDTPILIYDNSGNRHLTWPERFSTGSNGSAIEFRPMLSPIPLSGIKAIAAEEPHTYTVRDVLVDYPDRPPRSHAAYLDTMAERLGLAGLSPDKLSQYQFKNPQEAIDVVDIIRGDWHIRNAVEAIRYGNPRVKISDLDKQTQDKIHRAANKWANWGYLSPYGIQLGLMGQWPEFFDMAAERLGSGYLSYQDYPGYDRTMLSADRNIANAMANYTRQLTPGQVRKLKALISTSTDGSVLKDLFTCLARTQSQAVIDASWELSQDDRPWIWWQAMQIWHRQTYEKSRSYANLPEKMKLRLVLARGVPDDKDLQARAHAMLPAMFTPQLARMDSGIWSDVRLELARNFDKKTATEVYIGFLRRMQTDMTAQQWANNDIYKNRSKWMVSYLIRTLNVWYDVNIGNQGTDETPESGRTEPRTLPEFNQLIAEALQWYDGNRDLKLADLPFAGRVADTAGKGIANALLTLTKLEDTVDERGYERQQRVEVGTFGADADGSFAFVPPPDKYPYDLTVTAPGFITQNPPAFRRLPDGRYRLNDGNVIEMQRPGGITGRVIAENGEPLANAKLRLSSGDEYSTSLGGRAEPMTDAQGRFVLDNVHSGYHVLSYHKSEYIRLGNISHGQYGGICAASVVYLDEGQSLENAVLDLAESNCSLEVEVVDGEDNPVTSATIWLQVKIPSGRYKFADIFNVYNTSERGVYRFENLPPIEGYVLVRSEELEFSSKVEVKLLPQETARCRVKYKDKLLPENNRPDAPQATELTWGQPVNGLRAAVEFIPEKQRYSFGEKIGLRFQIQNTGNEPAQFVSSTWRQESRTIVEDQNGQPHTVSHNWYSGETPIERYYLKPGQRVVIDSSALGIAADNKQADELGHPVGHKFTCRPGTYFVSFPLIIPDVTSSSLPAQEEDWTGTLETGKHKLVVAAADTEDAPWGEPVPSELLPGEDMDASWGKAVHGVQVGARVEKVKWHIDGDVPRIEVIEKWRIGGDAPCVNVEVRVSDPREFQESGLATRPMDHDISAVVLEIDGKQYKNPTEYFGEKLHCPLQSPFKLKLFLDDEWQESATGKSLYLNPCRHVIRVLFVGLGMKPPPAGGVLEIEVLPDDKKLEPWPHLWGKAVEGVQVSAYPAKPSWPVGSEPVIKVRLRNQGERKRSIHLRPNSFALEVDGKRYENNFIFHVSGRPFAPNDEYEFDLKLSKTKPFHDGLRKGNSWPPVGKSPPLLPGKHTIHVLFTELRIQPEPGSQPVEFEIVPDTPTATELTWGEALNGLRMRATAPAGTVYRRGMSLPLVLEIQNVSEQPIPLNKLSSFLSFKVTDEQNRRLGVHGYLYNHLASWEGLDDALAPGEIISDRCYLERLRFKMPSPAESVTLHFQLPTQKEVPGELPINQYSNPVTVQLEDLPFEHLLKSEDLPESWTEDIDIVYREMGIWSGNLAMHIDAKARVTTVGIRLRADAPISNGRHEYVLDRGELDRLMRQLREFKIERLNVYDRKMFATDLVHVHLSIAKGGHTFSGEYELFGSKTEPVSAFQQIMRDLLARIVPGKKPAAQVE